MPPVAEMRLGRHLDPSNPRISRSEEHTSELQSLRHLVCRLLLEKNSATPSSTPRPPRPPDCLASCPRGRRSRVACHLAGHLRAGRGERRAVLARSFHFFLMIGRPPRSTLFPDGALFR